MFNASSTMLGSSTARRPEPVMRILITGVTGFVGGHLAERLLHDGGHNLHGLNRSGVWPAELAHLRGAVELHAIDLQRAPKLEHLLLELRPEWIFHLAGYANTGKSFQEPMQAWEGNWRATFNLYEAIAQSKLRPRVLYASTGLIYGSTGSGDRPLCETVPLFPASPYAASKSAADLLSYQVTRHPGLDVVRVRCFNQIGPRQSPEYATANFARQIAAIERGEQSPVLETGDLSGQRDLTDVRDMVRAFVALMEHGVSGEAYNAGSGRSLPMRAVLERMLAKSRARIEIRERSDGRRSGDTASVRAGIAKLQVATGWQAEHSLDSSLADLIDYWRTRREPIRKTA
jgi:GDP-4-dehydro-6-deoxy-D-mannose reductase